jgi:hypothetical protein
MRGKKRKQISENTRKWTKLEIFISTSISKARENIFKYKLQIDYRGESAIKKQEESPKIGNNVTGIGELIEKLTATNV